MSEEERSVGISKTVFVIGLIIAIAASSTISALVTTQTDWAKGPKGDTGDTGPQGEQGAKGDTGPAGEDGREVVFAQWSVTWYTISGDGVWGSAVGTSDFPATFDYDWGSGKIFLGHDDYIGFGASMQIKMQRDGQVAFTVGSDDGTQLFLDGDMIINNWDTRYYRTKRIITNLSQGTHQLWLSYYELWGNARVSFDCDPDILTWLD